ncbi:MAG: CAP domain-containing protein [Chloroflexota bacterium]
MFTTARRLAALLLAGMLIVPLAAPVGAVEPVVQDPAVDPVTPEVLAQAERDLVTLTNRQRASYGLIDLRMDPDLMAIARDRAEVMAANELMSHTEPDGRKVWDRLNDAHITWFAGGEILAWNHYPTEYTTAEAIRAWMASPGHHDIMVSTGYNYVGFGAAVSASGIRYYAGVFIREPDETGALARFGSISKRSVDHTHTRVTIRWSGADRRLQVLTSGLRYFQVQRRRVGGAWHSWPITTATHRTVTWSKAYDREVRVRARDRAGNWGSWKVIRINL